MKGIPPKQAEKWLDLLPGNPGARAASSDDTLIVAGTRDRFPDDPAGYDRIFLPMDEEWERWQRWHFQCFSRQLRGGGVLYLCPQSSLNSEGYTRQQGIRQRLSRFRSCVAASRVMKRLGRFLVPASLRSSAAGHGLQLDLLGWRDLAMPPAICFRKQEAWLGKIHASPAVEMAATFQQHFGAWCDASGLPPSISGAEVIGVESLIEGKPAATVLVLSPHPDDELIGCGGTLLLLAEAGARIHVVQMTEGATCLALREANQAEKRSIRWEEAEAVAGSLGFHSHFWPTGSNGALADDAITRQRLRELIQELQPSLIFAPAASDLHPEHRLAFRLVAEAVTAIPPTAMIFEYPVWGFLPWVSHAVETTRSHARVVEALYSYRTAMKAEDYATRCRVLASDHAERLFGDSRRKLEVFRASLSPL